MNKIVLGLLVGGILGIFDGLSAWFTPAVRAQLLGIVIGSTVKGLIAGILIGYFAKKVNSLAAGPALRTGRRTAAGICGRGHAGPDRQALLLRNHASGRHRGNDCGLRYAALRSIDAIGPQVVVWGGRPRPPPGFEFAGFLTRLNKIQRQRRRARAPAPHRRTGIPWPWLASMRV